MYYIKNNILCNDKRKKINKVEIVDLIKKHEYNNLFYANVYYNKFYIVEIDYYTNNDLYKYFIVCDDESDLNIFRDKLEVLRKNN